MGRDETTVIDKKTKVPLVWLIAAIIACSGGAISFYKVQVGQENILHEIGDLRKMIWTRSEHREFSDDLRENNPGLKVPHVRIEPAEIRSAAIAEVK